MPDESKPFPAAMVNGRRILHVFQVEGERRIFRSLDEAVEMAERMEPPATAPAPGAA